MASQKIFNILKDNRLERFYNKCLQLGAENELDLLDITDSNLTDMGLTPVERNRFNKMKETITRLGTGKRQPVKKSCGAFCLYVVFPKCPDDHIEITGMDPSQNTVEDLMMRIIFQLNITNRMSVSLFSAEGMPLTDDAFFNTWSLQDRHIENGSKLYAIFTPKDNLSSLPPPMQNDIQNKGPDTVTCHIMLKGNFGIHVDLEDETFAQLVAKLSHESGIPRHVLHSKDNYTPCETLAAVGINKDETVHFTLSSLHETSFSVSDLFISDIKPAEEQTQKGLSIFLSALQVIKLMHSGDEFKKVIAYIRKLTGCNALAQSLFQLVCNGLSLTKTQKIAVVEGLYFLFRELLPSLSKRHGDKIIEDKEVFEHANVCWAYLLSQGNNQSSEHENYAPISLKAQSTGQRFSEPVRVPGTPEIFDKQYVLEKIRDDEKIPNCSEERLAERSIERATDIEKILLSLPPSFESYHLWISYDAAQTSCNFNINPEKTYGQMCAELSNYAHLNITPPLLLKGIGVPGPRLVYLKEDNLGVYMCKDKAVPQNISVFDSKKGKTVSINVDVLANELRDVRADLTINVTKTPKEAIVVLFDSSSSMGGECYDTKMKRIDAIKQVFDSFSNRCMAYDFAHVICLVKFNSTVKTLHSFTENLETFKEYVNGLQESGQTVLYDALNHGLLELLQVKKKFPDCRCRILCLTDGDDVGSTHKSVDVAKNLMLANVVVDAVIVGKVGNNVLHGISNVTGGCCFRPQTSKEAMKLFEMETVLSMELRKDKKKYNVASINAESDLTKIFITFGYDEKPEVELPSQINSRVTVTQNALKKKIMESKSGRFLEKDKRILEELKSLHCDPHPYCTVLPSESDITFWKILMQGPPDTPYEKGTFELYCQFGPEYPVKPPLVRFFTPVYHCNVNSVGRICHNIFDRNYSAHITMREILDAVYGLLIAPEPEDPLDSILAEEYLSSKDKYEEEARKNTEKDASPSIDDIEKKYVGPELSQIITPPNLVCQLSRKLFVDPVKTKDGFTYERRAIENYVKMHRRDPFTKKLLRRTDWKEDKEMKKSVKQFRRCQIQETAI